MSPEEYYHVNGGIKMQIKVGGDLTPSDLEIRQLKQSSLYCEIYCKRRRNYLLLYFGFSSLKSLPLLVHTFSEYVITIDSSLRLHQNFTQLRSRKPDRSPTRARGLKH